MRRNKKKATLIFLILIYSIIYVYNFNNPNIVGVYSFSNEVLEFEENGIYYRSIYMKNETRIDTGYWRIGSKSHIWLNHWAPKEEELRYIDYKDKIQIAVPFDRNVIGNVNRIVLNRDLNIKYEK